MRKLVSRNLAANVEWQLWKDDTGYDNDQVTLSVLMDIRAELQRLNRLLHCPNFTAVPSKLDKIERNTRKKRRRVVGKPKLRIVTRS